jgi:hypothetical protein
MPKSPWYLSSLFQPEMAYIESIFHARCQHCVTDLSARHFRANYHERTAILYLKSGLDMFVGSPVGQIKSFNMTESNLRIQFDEFARVVDVAAHSITPFVSNLPPCFMWNM